MSACVRVCVCTCVYVCVCVCLCVYRASRVRRRDTCRERLYPSLAARYLEKKTRRFLDFFREPPLPVSSGSPEVDPTIDQNMRSG